MGITVREVSTDFVVKKAALPLSTKNAWALYARRRWPHNGVKAAMAEWDLMSEGQARGLFAAQISQGTIDHILDHPNGGFGLGLVILEIRTQTGLAAWVSSERKRLADEAERQNANAAALGEMARDLTACLRLGGARGDLLDQRRSWRRDKASGPRGPGSH